MSDTTLRLNILGNARDANRAIHSVQREMTALRAQIIKHNLTSREQHRVTRELNRQISNQQRGINRLTLEYVSLRRAVLSLGVRSAVTGFAALTSAVGGAGTAVASLASEVGTLSVALGAMATTGIASIVQGFSVFALATDKVGKALTTTGKDHEKALQKLTKSARAFVGEAKDLQMAFREVKLLAQEGMFSGFLKALRTVRPLLVDVKQVVYDTALVWGYLAEKAANAAVRQRATLHDLGEMNVITMRRMGEATIAFGESFAIIMDEGEGFLRRQSAALLGWARDFRKSIGKAAADGTLAEMFQEAEESWDRWRAIGVNSAVTVFNTLKAGYPVFEGLNERLRAATQRAREFTSSKGGQQDIRSYFKTMEPVTRAMGNALWDTLAALTRLSVVGSGNAVRVFEGWSNKVLPLIENLAENLNANLLPAFLDLGSNLVDYFNQIRPALIVVSKLVAGFFITISKAIEGLNFLLDRLPDGVGAVAGLAIGVGVLLSWGRFKSLLGETLLTLRQILHTTDKIAVNPLATRGSGTAATVVGGVGGGGRGAGGGSAGGASRASTGQFLVPPRPVASPRTQGWQGAAPYVVSRAAITPPRLYRQDRNSTQFRGAGGRFVGYPTFRSGVTSGDPLSGRRGGGTAFEYHPRQRMGRTALAGQAWAQLPGVMAASTKQVGAGIVTAARQAAPKVGSIMRGTFATAAVFGLISGIAGRKDELGKTLAGTIRNALSGATFGAISSTGEQADSLYKGAIDALNRGGNFKADITKAGGFFDTLKKTLDEQINPKNWLKFSVKDEDAKRMLKVNLSTALGVHEFRMKYLTALRDGKKITQEQFEVLSKSAREMELLRGAQEGANKMGLKIDDKDVTGRIGNIIHSFEQMRNLSIKSLQGIKNSVRNNMSTIKRSMVEGSASSKDAMAKNFQLATRAVQHNMRLGRISVREGMKFIRSMLEQELQVYGFSAKQARNYTRGRKYDKEGNLTDAGGVSPWGGPEEGGRARGGAFTVGRKGEAGPDQVALNAVVGKGEDVVVFNRHQRKVVDERFADMGGLTGFFRQGWADHSKPMAGLADRAKGYAKGGIVSLGRRLQKMGYHVGEHPLFGGVHPVHAENSRHYHNAALDINADNWPGGEPSALDKLAAILRREGWHFLWRVAGHFDHLHVDDINGPGGLGGLTGGMDAPKLARVITGMPGAYGAGIQGALDTVRGAAQKRLDDVFGSAIDTGGMGQVKGALSRKQIASLMRQAGFPESEIRTGVAVAMAESGGDPNVQNDIGATGLWQILLSAHPSVSAAQARDPLFATKYAKRLWDERGWQPWEAYTNGMYRKFMKRGGLLTALAAAVGLPPRDQGTPFVSTDDAVTGRGGNKDSTSSSGSKKKKKKKPPVYGPNRVSNARVERAKQQTRELLGRGARGKYKRPAVRGKVRWWEELLKGGKWVDDPSDLVDPLTGEFKEVDQLAMFQGIRGQKEYITKVDEDYGYVLGEHGLTDEFLTVPIKGDELKAWIRAQGITNVQGFIDANGEPLEIVNPGGAAAVGGKRGIAEAVGELAYQQSLRQRIKDAWIKVQDQSVAMQPGVADAIKYRIERLKEMRNFFKSNQKVIKRLTQKIAKARRKKGNVSWRDQIKDNDHVIDALQDHLRMSRRLPESYRDKISNDIDDLRDLNKQLREKKPTTNQFQVQRLVGLRERRYIENEKIAGTRDTDVPWSESLGGLASVAFDSLRNWRSIEQYRGDSQDEAGKGIRQEGINIGEIQKEIDRINATKVEYNFDIAADTADRDKQLSELREEALRESLANARLDRAQFGALQGFAQMLGMRYLGAFSHGTARVAETGLALVHKNETIVPDPYGPFRTGGVMGRISGGDGGPTVVEVHLNDRAGALVELVDARIVKKARPAVSGQTGRVTRTIIAAPGR